MLAAVSAVREFRQPDRAVGSVLVLGDYPAPDFHGVSFYPTPDRLTQLENRSKAAVFARHGMSLDIGECVDARISAGRRFPARKTGRRCEVQRKRPCPRQLLAAT